MMYLRTCLAVGLLLPFPIVGCGPRAVSVDSWKQSVEAYVWSECNGDPNCLRNLTWDSPGRGPHRGFAVFSDQLPRKSTDAKGLLLAHAQLGSNKGFVFLLGIVKERDVEDLRVALLTVRDGQFDWRVGEANSDALKRYKQFNESLWRQRFPGRDKAPLAYLGFPLEADVFTVSMPADALVVTHAPSGAQWQLPLPPDRRPLTTTRAAP